MANYTFKIAKYKSVDGNIEIIKHLPNLYIILKDTQGITSIELYEIGEPLPKRILL